MILSSKKRWYRKIQTFFIKNQSALKIFSSYLFNTFEIQQMILMSPVPSTTCFSKMLKVFLLFAILLLSVAVFSQGETAINRKLSPALSRSLLHLKQDQLYTFVISVSAKDTFKSLLGKIPGINTVYEYPISNLFLIRCNWATIQQHILLQPAVLFIDEHRKAKEENAVSNLDLSTNKVNLLQSRFPMFNGQSITVSVKENRPDTADIDFKGRYIQTPLTSTIFSSHASTMSTIIAGAGNTYYEGKGVAPGATITSASFATLLPEPDTYYQQYEISTQNHSYGTGIENFYGNDAMAYDASVIARPSLLHVFSAGNSGTSNSTTGTYAGIVKYANITGSFKMSKNGITVGHTDSFATVLPLSSRGPAYDGRVKPELVAFAEDGSSGATAIVSGIALTLQHAYKNIHGSLPGTALVKALLLNSANDVNAAGIDFISGYGAANGYKAMQGMINGNYFQSTVVQSAISEHVITISPVAKQVKITLVWSDPSSSPNAAKSLVNDLDVELVNINTNEVWLPWVLSAHPHVDSLVLLPVRKKDTLNNAEQITVADPAPGTYIIRVKGTHINIPSSQSYAIAFQVDTLNKFNWQYPTRMDNLVAGETNLLRWESSFPNAQAQLEYSVNDGNSWQLINAAANISNGFYKWNTPDTFTTALLRVTVGGNSFLSDTFSISKRINTFVGFNCSDSFSFYWNRPKGVSSFQVYKLGDRYLEPLLTTTDTLLVLSTAADRALHYTIAPILNGKTGLKSITFNYTTQGVECYIRSFLGSLSGNSSILNLVLGTTYNISSIVLEKWNGTAYVALQQTSNINSVTFSFTDAQLQQSLNIYRIRIVLADGRSIFSQAETVYFAPSGNIAIYPNPVQQGQSLNILPADLTQTIRLQVISQMGQKLLEMPIENIPTILMPGKLTKGIYLFRFIKEDGTVSIYRVLIL